MIKQFFVWAAWMAFALGLGLTDGSATEVTSPDVADWMDAALAGKPTPLPEEGDTLERDEVQSQTTLLWRAYKDAAIRAGWDKELLEVPKPIDQMMKNGPKLEIPTGLLKSGDKSMPYALIAKGEKPDSGWPLFISMHGGGKHHGRDKIQAHGWNVNSMEWQTQFKLTVGVYKPAGLYFLPRMADDRLGRWWHKHNIDIFTRVIRRAILFNEVDPNRIYIMGISQGGYGTCHLAPFLADHFAAAGPMAGGMMTVTESLRNLPFRSDIGEFDQAFNRIELAKKLHARIDSHKMDDPDGYTNVLAVQKGRGHGIDYSRSPRWLAQHTRNPLPGRIVWKCGPKDGLYRESFYWLSLTEKPKEGEFSIVATLDRDNNGIDIQAEEVVPSKENSEAVVQPLKASKIILHLNDKMLDLEKEVAVRLNGKEVFKGMVVRSRGTIMRNLVNRGDLNYAFPAELIVEHE